MFGFAKLRAKNMHQAALLTCVHRSIGDVPEDIELHKPYVDEIKLKSPSAEGGDNDAYTGSYRRLVRQRLDAVCATASSV